MSHINKHGPTNDQDLAAIACRIESVAQCSCMSWGRYQLEVSLVPHRAVNRKESLCASSYVSFSMWRTLPWSFWSATNHCHSTGGAHLWMWLSRWCSLAVKVHESCNLIKYTTTLSVRRPFFYSRVTLKFNLSFTWVSFWVCSTISSTWR